MKVTQKDKNTNLNNAKSKILKFGLPALGLFLLIYGLSKVNWSGGANNYSDVSNTENIIAEDLSNIDTLNLKKEPVKTKQEEYQDLINKANALFLSDKYAEAKRKYHAALKINSKDKSAKKGVAKCEAALKAKTPTPTSKKNTINKLSSPIQKLLNDMIFVRGGTFKMGCTSEQEKCYNDEKPVHSVTLSSYKIAKYELTQEQWRAVMGSDPPELRFTGCNKCPVERVSWNDIQDFIKKLNRLTGKNFRLPTEAEWEYAAKGGNKSSHYQYAGGNSLKDVAWYEGNSDKKTHSVGQKKPNELGLYDMSGNVWEWCSDWYGKDYYSSKSSKNPKGASSGSSRVIRSGSWYNGIRNCSVVNRGLNNPDNRNDIVGFRLAQ